MEYNSKDIEKKWQNFWSENQSFEPSDDKTKEKKYILSMFPYPSGRIHMGHVRNYCLGDAFARHFRKSNFSVLHPIGWDSFGMPAENAAIKNKLHPKKWTYENIDYMRDELRALGYLLVKQESLQQVMNYIQNGNKSSSLKCMKKSYFIENLQLLIGVKSVIQF